MFCELSHAVSKSCTEKIVTGIPCTALGMRLFFCPNISWAWILQGLQISSLFIRVVSLGGAWMPVCTQAEVFQEQRKVNYATEVIQCLLISSLRMMSWENLREKMNADNWQASGSALRKAGKHASPRTRAPMEGGERRDGCFAPRQGLEVAGEPRPPALLIVSASCSK